MNMPSKPMYCLLFIVCCCPSSLAFFGGVFRSSRLESIEKAIGQLVDANLETAANLKSLEASQERTENKLGGLSDYAQNQTRNQSSCLEETCAAALRSYIVNTLMVPEQCVFEYKKKVLLHPGNCSTAVEWDGVFLVDYSEAPEELKTNTSLHNTLFLLEIKAMLRARQVLLTIPSRVSATQAVISFDYVGSKMEMGRTKNEKLRPQMDFFPSSPTIIVAIGGANICDENTKLILSSGMLAVVPNGADFSVFS